MSRASSNVYTRSFRLSTLSSFVILSTAESTYAIAIDANWPNTPGTMRTISKRRCCAHACISALMHRQSRPFRSGCSALAIQNPHLGICTSSLRA